MTIEGKCESCQKYFRPNPEKTECDSWCDANERIDANARCVPCEKGTYVDYNIDPSVCVTPDCKSNEVVNQNGECGPCPPYSVLSDD